MNSRVVKNRIFLTRPIFLHVCTTCSSYLMVPWAVSKIACDIDRYKSNEHSIFMTKTSFICKKIYSFLLVNLSWKKSTNISKEIWIMKTYLKCTPNAPNRSLVKENQALSNVIYYTLFLRILYTVHNASYHVSEESCPLL